MFASPLSHVFFPLTDFVKAAYFLLLGLWTNKSEIIKLCDEEALLAAHKYIGCRQ